VLSVDYRRDGTPPDFFVSCEETVSSTSAHGPRALDGGRRAALKSLAAFSLVVPVVCASVRHSWRCGATCALPRTAPRAARVRIEAR
jgi:hypothetical protein